MIFVLPSACIFENKLSCRRTYQAQILPPLVRMRKQLGTKATSLSWRLQDSAEKRNLPKDQLENLLPCWLPQQIVTLISSSGKGAGKSTVHTNTTSGSLQPALSGAWKLLVWWVGSFAQALETHHCKWTVSWRKSWSETVPVFGPNTAFVLARGRPWVCTQREDGKNMRGSWSGFC